MADQDVVSLGDLKTMLQIDSDNTDSDALLNLIIKNTIQSIRVKLALKEKDNFPDELSYIPLEVCVRRFNRLRNEGMKSYSQEGESITFSTNDFDDFQNDIEAWKQQQSKAATVSFICGYN